MVYLEVVNRYSCHSYTRYKFTHLFSRLCCYSLGGFKTFSRLSCSSLANHRPALKAPNVAANPNKNRRCEGLLFGTFVLPCSMYPDTPAKMIVPDSLHEKQSSTGIKGPRDSNNIGVNKSARGNAYQLNTFSEQI